MAQGANSYRNTKKAGGRYTTATYTEGNTVRVIEHEIPKKRRSLSEKEKKEKERREKEERRRQIRRMKNRDKALQMNPGFVFFVSLAAACVLMISIHYLKVQASITAAMNTIEKKEVELEALKVNNDLLEKKIQTYADLDYIYETAVGLGMIHPSGDQVVYYEKTESEYVRQYENIP
ncbi:MAG: cell division protein FtsL [Lachnospiraceae bacterium]|jgi:cell division protein FtsL|nr:cell division protein FtsL [Lachnospiraceae bacterium]